VTFVHGYLKTEIENRNGCNYLCGKNLPIQIRLNVKIIDLNCSFKAKTVFISLKAENNFLLLKFFVYFFGGLQCVGHSFAYVPFNTFISF